MSGKFWSSSEDERLAKMILHGLSNKEIARALGRSAGSVAHRAHVKQIKRMTVKKPVDFTIRLPGDLYDRLEAETQRRGMTKGYFYRTLLERELNQCTNI